ncbi:Crp/Fnr family transcriptional regulator [Marivirga sp. S37H4]|uniref:Crp/Fnr family transcriptional regulator n=1 Tax=Marivirga aurantiaca TaxID=2802615 RepID=A0A934WWN0_9BACT|nr:Crp/Fnr family transcriptional regulator [Marivirga aurantiaca]MBK6264458.1 Crp/Fnr family transcriptional regulator [Marivirga aurantiaca]
MRTNPFSSLNQRETSFSSFINNEKSVLPFAEMHDYVEKKFFRKGQILFNPGVIARGLFFIKSGKLKISRYGSNAKEQIIKILSEGDVLGHQALLFKKKFSDYAEVIEDAEIFYMDARDFEFLCSKNPEIMAHFVKLLCSDLERIEERLVSLAYEPVRGRLASLLLELEVIYRNGSVAIINLSRSNLAKLAGTAKETAIRLLTEFKAEGLISSEGQDLIIKNPKGLKRIAKLYH